MGEEKKEPGMTLWGPEGGSPQEDYVRESHTSESSFWLTGLFTSPKGVLQREVGEGNAVQALARVAVVYLVAGILAMVFLFALRAVNILIAAYLLVGMPLLAASSFLFSQGILYIFAKIFGGKGSFGTQSYVFSLLVMFSFVIGLLMVPMQLIPCIGLVASMLFTLYMLYLAVLAMMVSHKLDPARAFIVILAPALLAIALAYMAITLFPGLLQLAKAFGQV